MVRQKSSKILGCKRNADVVTVEKRQGTERIHTDFYTMTLPIRELENLFVLPACPFSLPLEPPLSVPPTLNFLTKFHTDLVVSWLFVSGTMPAGLICLLL